METWKADAETFTRDFYAVTLDGFFPGLRPRGHEEVLGEGAAAWPAEAVEVTAAEIETEILTTAWETVAGALPWREAVTAAEVLEAPPSAPPPAAPPPPSSKPPAPPPSAPVPRRLVRARRRITAFRPRNVYQRQLRKLLLVITDHLRRHCCQAGREADFERWWAVLEIYRGVLEAPEMAASKARSVLPRVLEITHGSLTPRAVECALGRRKPKRKRQQRKGAKR